MHSAVLKRRNDLLPPDAIARGKLQICTWLFILLSHLNHNSMIPATHKSLTWTLDQGSYLTRGSSGRRFKEWNFLSNNYNTFEVLFQNLLERYCVLTLTLRIIPILPLLQKIEIQRQESSSIGSIARLGRFWTRHHAPLPHLAWVRHLLWSVVVWSTSISNLRQHQYYDKTENRYW